MISKIITHLSKYGAGFILGQVNSEKSILDGMNYYNGDGTSKITGENCAYCVVKNSTKIRKI